MLCAAALVLPAFGAQAGVVLTTLYSFQSTNGANPYAGLVQGSDGNFYGTTRLTTFPGGTVGGYGTVFKISTNGALTSLYSFTGGNDGANPYAGLVQGSDGYFYGTTSGGTYGNGTVFQISTNGALTNLYSFTGGNDGAYPSQLVQCSDGYFYGTTGALYGGPNSGTVFKISSNGAYHSLYSFTGSNGADPFAGLAQGSDGFFYGTTYYTTFTGGTVGGYGTVFKISTNGALTSLYSFSGGNDGAHPAAVLVQGRDGYFYGTTVGGGIDGGYGTVFKISTNGALTSLHSFNFTDGEAPESLMQAGDGYFYGTAFNGGRSTAYDSSGNGTLFKMSTNGALITLYSFGTIQGADGSSVDGANPVGPLVLCSDGSFYGTTAGGGPGDGTVFRLTVPTAPTFQAVTLTNGMLGLTWSTEAGGMYQLQYTPDLSSDNWTNLSNVVTAAGATLSATDFVTNGPRRFYRVVLLP